MTYSQSQLHNILKCDAAKTAATDSAGRPSLFQALVSAALVLLARFSKKRGPKTRNILILTLTLLLALHGGTREEKRAFLKRLLARHEERQERLYARYLAWRQRKCWMWGGGFQAGALKSKPHAVFPAHDQTSFDALIPD